MAGKEIEEIKKRIDLVEFIKGYVDLQPAGKSLKALCPFHGEKTPSFVVSPERGRWHCFGSCGEGGDIFTFLMKYENIEFYEALQVLAARAGVELQKIDPQQQREFGVLYDIHETAKKFFQEELKKNSRALAYLRERGLEERTIETFELGYSPGGEALTKYLLDAGYDMRDIERAGVSYKNSRGNYWDKFQRRIIFPIANSVGKTVAFTGRVLPEISTNNESETNKRINEFADVPKYLNSPETPIFHKSKILYGYSITKKAIGDARTAFLVEGQMDVLMSWQAGVPHVVAVSGTGLTEHHLEKLRRTADSVILSFDNDEAGTRAMERALALFSKFDFHVQVIELGEHKDPADAARAEPGFLKKALEGARAAFPRLFEIRFGEVPRADIAGRKHVLRELLLKLKLLRSPTEQEIWLRELSKVSGISESALRAEFDALETPVPSPQASAQVARALPEEAGRLLRIDLISRRLLSLAFFDEGLLEALQNEKESLPARYREILDEPKGEIASRVGMQGAV
ncbi:MAG: DNA primase, partial [Patescibacteria group bacterium]